MRGFIITGYSAYCHPLIAVISSHAWRTISIPYWLHIMSINTKKSPHRICDHSIEICIFWDETGITQANLSSITDNSLWNLFSFDREKRSRLDYGNEWTNRHCWWFLSGTGGHLNCVGGYNLLCMWVSTKLQVYAIVMFLRYLSSCM